MVEFHSEEFKMMQPSNRDKTNYSIKNTVPQEDSNQSISIINTAVNDVEENTANSEKVKYFKSDPENHEDDDNYHINDSWEFLGGDN